MGKKNRPGVMMYFDMWHALEYLDDREKGQLMDGIVRYAELGEEPVFPWTVEQVWPFVRMTLDRDKERYEDRCRKSRYANYVKGLPEGVVPPEYEEWAKYCGG